MTMPASRRTRDIRLSITHRIGDSLTVTSPSQTSGGAPVTRTVPVYHSSPWADPDSMGAPSGTQEAAWIGTTWLQDGAGYYGHSVLQVDVYTRQLAETDADQDAIGLFNAEVADAVCEIFAGCEASGHLRAYIDILDFTDPSNPVPPPDGEGGHVICQTPQGRPGVPTERRSLGRRGGLWRTSVRFAFRGMVDAGFRRGSAYYTPRG